jgi:S-adenosylmethionine synthetase
MERRLARTSHLFTSESVSEGHPDKVCDRISDTIVDLFLSKDPEARVACETLTTTNRIVLAGEIRVDADIDDAEIEERAREAVRDIGYEQDGFHWKTCAFSNYLHEQSAHIAQGVDASEDKEEGAGDQGIMFGFACDETPELMPAPITYAHQILKRMAELRKSGERPEFEPDAKSQVSLRYENGKPAAVTSVVVSSQHREGVSQQELRELIRPVVTEGIRPHETRAERYKASFALVHDDNEEEACIGCKLCENICPSDVITVTAAKKRESPVTGKKRGYADDFTLDLQACIYCELCV